MNFMKKKAIAIVMVLFLITGCSNPSSNFISYQETKALSENNITSSKISEVFDFFSSDLTVVTDSDNHMEDSNITASSALILNASDNQVIYANNVYERLYPASLTKLITALVVLRNGNLEDTVTVSYNASHITESGAKLCGFKEGDKIQLEVILNALLVYSGNDAGIAIAEHIGGSEEGFAKLMNETAKELGAVHSNFVNSHGLHDDNQYTTAYDLYLIFNKLIQYEEFISIINQTSYMATYTNSSDQPISKEFLTTNRYLKGTESAPTGITVLGGKTGTTSKAGNCLVLYSKDSEEKEYISILLKADGGNSLFYQMTKLLEKIE